MDSRTRPAVAAKKGLELPVLVGTSPWIKTSVLPRAAGQRNDNDTPNGPRVVGPKMELLGSRMSVVAPMLA